MRGLEARGAAGRASGDGLIVIPGWCVRSQRVARMQKGGHGASAFAHPTYWIIRFRG